MAYEAILLLDRAYFARIIGEPNWSRDEVAKADAIAESIDWNELPGEERIGLLLMAEAMAESNPEKGALYLARYKGLDRIRSPLHLFALDHRCDAFAAYAEGVAKLKGGEPGAEEALRTAWTIFDRIGYDWRASRTALSLLEATKKNAGVISPRTSWNRTRNRGSRAEFLNTTSRRPKPFNCHACSAKSSTCSARR